MSANVTFISDEAFQAHVRRRVDHVMQRTLVEPQPAMPVFLAGQGGRVDVSVKSMKMTWGNVFATVFKFWVVANIYFGLAVLFWFVLISALLEG